MDKSGLRAILAHNIGRILDADTPRGQRRSVRAWATGKGLNVRLIDRLLKGQHAVTLDTLEEVAAACGLQAWHLLLEDFEPGQSLQAPITDQERALLRRLRQLITD